MQTKLLHDFLASVDKTKLFIYAASGFAASLAAIIFVSRVSTTRSDMGMGLELDAITAVVLGGLVFLGVWSIVGTFGLILIQILKWIILSWGKIRWYLHCNRVGLNINSINQ